MARSYANKDVEEAWRKGMPRNHVYTLDSILKSLSLKRRSRSLHRTINSKLQALIDSIPQEVATPQNAQVSPPPKKREKIPRGRIRLRDLKITAWEALPKRVTSLTPTRLHALR